MEVYANFRQKVFVNPKDVIEKMIEEEIGWQHWIFEENGKYYVGWEQSAGAHSYDAQEEISKEQYDYVNALKNVLNHLKSNNND